MKILSPRHTLFAAMILRDNLIKLGFQCKIVEQIDLSDNDIYFLYNASPIYKLPKRYVIMQTEIAGSHWFSNGYRQTIKNALAVWDYSEQNYTAYDHDRRLIVTPGLSPQPEKEKDIPFMFYGWIKGSERREKAIEQLKINLNLTVQTNLTGPNMWQLLARTKVVINVHYYDHSPMELYRIYESISHGCEVWLQDEGRYFEGAHDNLEEIKQGLGYL